MLIFYLCFRPISKHVGKCSFQVEHMTRGPAFGAISLDGNVSFQNDDKTAMVCTACRERSARQSRMQLRHSSRGAYEVRGAREGGWSTGSTHGRGMVLLFVYLFIYVFS